MCRYVSWPNVLSGSIAAQEPVGKWSMQRVDVSEVGITFPAAQLLDVRLPQANCSSCSSRAFSEDVGIKNLGLIA